jgi:hypothetical protein
MKAEGPQWWEADIHPALPGRIGNDRQTASVPDTLFRQFDTKDGTASKPENRRRRRSQCE